MSLPDVLNRGDDFLAQYPRRSSVWNFFSHGTCLATIGFSKLILKAFYNVKLNHFDKLERAIDGSKNENRGLITVMNHMSCVDDPFLWAVFPWRIYRDVDTIRWCLGAHNICFQNTVFGTFFSLGKVLSTERFGAGPFQGSIDAAVRLLSPDDTMDLEWFPPGENVNKPAKEVISLAKKAKTNYFPPVKRSRPAWMHVYPEGFVLQLHPPFNNSMRYFKWGVSRMILESTVAPIIVPIFTTGFEKIASEETAGTMIKRYLPTNFGAEINVTVGDPIELSIIESYRQKWQKLVEKYHDPEHPTDLSPELIGGKEAQSLRSAVAAELRKHIAKIRHEERNFPQEDPRFESPSWWKNYTATEGTSDPDVKFVGVNWAIRRLQSYLPENNLDANDNTNNSKKT
ncbi:lyso-phosphatidylcholine acyltransferase [Zygosaccharomyces mellis]|uniref:Tafazzin family protein n=1 Tax=Zygosaccharomyces mellis TaxID=42258 RepID=A0A4C2DZQ6_9SACH|nr:lyso-phosphatidylcholine acyltransferase [Zygosaccharomyces mellis]